MICLECLEEIFKYCREPRTGKCQIKGMAMKKPKKRHPILAPKPSASVQFIRCMCGELVRVLSSPEFNQDYFGQCTQCGFLYEITKVKVKATYGKEKRS